jgi:hypothetical protein
MEKKWRFKRWYPKTIGGKIILTGRVTATPCLGRTVLWMTAGGLNTHFKFELPVSSRHFRHGDTVTIVVSRDRR